ncbi:MAG: hypothetical protein ACT6Q6_19220, partial [Hydrogenophaga sp.]
LTLSGLRQLDRPGIVTLRQSGQGSGLVLVTALTGDTATLQSGEQRWRMPLSTLADSWRGDFATLWRTPPGQTTRLVDGRTGPAADWLGERIAGLQTAGKVPPSAHQLSARIQAFQRANGIDAAGLWWWLGQADETPVAAPAPASAVPPPPATPPVAAVTPVPAAPSPAMPAPEPVQPILAPPRVEPAPKRPQASN